jgi:RNA polymerase sigma-70 factor (ECF subfamily)
MYLRLDCNNYVNGRTEDRLRRTRRRLDDQFDRLALAHREFLMRLAVKLTGDATSAEDLFQDTYLKAYRAFDTFDGASRCRAWLKRIMINTYINMYHRRRKLIFHLQDNEEISQYPDMPAQKPPECEQLNEDSILHNFVCDEIRDSLLLLPDGYRTTIILYDMLGLRYREISEILELPIGTVKSRIYRGRKTLREHLIGTDGDGNGHRETSCQ